MTLGTQWLWNSNVSSILQSEFAFYVYICWSIKFSIAVAMAGGCCPGHYDSDLIDGLVNHKWPVERWISRQESHSRRQILQASRDLYLTSERYITVWEYRLLLCPFKTRCIDFFWKLQASIIALECCIFLSRELQCGFEETCSTPIYAQQTRKMNKKNKVTTAGCRVGYRKWTKLRSLMEAELEAE